MSALECDFNARRGARGGAGSAFELRVQFAVERGFSVLFGPSGAGKSSVLNCIAGLLQPDSGRISVCSTVVFDSSARINLRPQQRKIGYVFQNSALFPHLSVFENIAFGCDDRGGAGMERQLMGLVKRFHLSGFEQRKPVQLSAGQMQRVALARAVAINPRLLLLDEPFSALDSELRDELGNEVRVLAGEMSLPVLMVTHSRAEAARLADTVVFLKGGSVVDVGGPSSVLPQDELNDEQADIS